MSRHTPGPWSCFVSIHGDDRTVDDCVHSDSKSAGDGDIICLSPERDGYEASAARWDENARLIAAAPAMDLALSMIACGAARIERSPSGRLEEFCFDGIRYCLNGDWNALFEVIGWDRAHAAIAKATGSEP